MSRIVTLLLLILVSCYHFQIEGPYTGRRTRPIKLLREGENPRKQIFTDKHKVWFAFWGLVPLTDNNKIAKLYTNKNIDAMRVEIKVEEGDAVINFFTRFVGIYCYTLKVDYTLRKRRRYRYR